jgi:hypothetical protein
MPSEVQGKWLPIPGDLYGNGTFALGSARNSGASPQFKSARWCSRSKQIADERRPGVVVISVIYIEG